jgi:hypothetical protein
MSASCLKWSTERSQKTRVPVIPVIHIYHMVDFSGPTGGNVSDLL